MTTQTQTLKKTAPALDAQATQQQSAQTALEADAARVSIRAASARDELTQQQSALIGGDDNAATRAASARETVAAFELHGVNLAAQIEAGAASLDALQAQAQTARLFDELATLAQTAVNLYPAEGPGLRGRTVFPPSSKTGGPDARREFFQFAKDASLLTGFDFKIGRHSRQVPVECVISAFSDEAFNHRSIENTVSNAPGSRPQLWAEITRHRAAFLDELATRGVDAARLFGFEETR